MKLTYEQKNIESQKLYYNLFENIKNFILELSESTNKKSLHYQDIVDITFCSISNLYSKLLISYYLEFLNGPEIKKMSFEEFKNNLIDYLLSVINESTEIDKKNFQKMLNK